MKIKKMLLVLIVAVFAVSGCGKDNVENTNTEKVEPSNLKTVIVSSPEKGSISNRLNFNGQVKPSVEYYVTSRIAERISKINVENGQPVEKGDVLFELESLNYHKNYVQAEASFNSAKSSLELAKKDFERNKVLYEKKVINDRTFDSAKNAFDNAENNFKKAEAVYVIAKDNFENTKITAPETGYFSDRNGEVGQMINPGFTFGRVLILEKIVVECYVSQSQVRRLSFGQKAEIDGRHGKIISINTSADSVSRNFLVKIEFDNNDYYFRPNSFVSGDFLLDTKNNVYLISKNSLLYDNSGYYIFVYENGQAKKLPINVEAFSDEKVYSPEISGDIKVIVSGQAVVEHGENIKISGE
ncbi:MAG: efflux RND transporter periplasmic adaptor subunit [Candidatus Muiribacteriota bacterium]